MTRFDCVTAFRVELHEKPELVFEPSAPERSDDEATT
jgi:hypothetical protein